MGLPDQPEYRPASTPDSECVCICGCGRPVRRADHDYVVSPSPIAKGQPRNYARGHGPKLNRSTERATAARAARGVPVEKVRELVRRQIERLGFDEVCRRLDWDGWALRAFLVDHRRRTCTKEWTEWLVRRLAGQAAVLPPKVLEAQERREARIRKAEAESVRLAEEQYERGRGAMTG